MSSINLKTSIVATILSKSLILLLNFAVIVLTTQLWGADGRGSVAIFVADLSFWDWMAMAIQENGTAQIDDFAMLKGFDLARQEAK